MNETRRAAALLCTALLLLFVAPHALAHKASDAYLQLSANRTNGTELRVDLALRDLDLVLDLDADGDGRLDWREVRGAWPAIERYALGRVGVDGCRFRAGAPALERRSDGAYAVLQLNADCTMPRLPSWHYTMFAEVDPTHRGIARELQADGSVAVTLLDPNGVHAPAASPQPAASAGDAADAAGSTASFVAEGVHHIVTGYDHLLFLLCLILPGAMRRDGGRWRPVARWRDAVAPLAWIVSAFTLAHSVTLALAALDLVSLPASLVEPAIAATIVLAAIDNLRPIFGRLRRWAVAFAFGLVHGFGFAGVLGELDLPPAEFAWALLRFNVGLELGQLAAVCAVLALLFALRHHRAYAPVAIGGGSAAAVAVGLLWFVERTAELSLLPL